MAVSLSPLYAEAYYNTGVVLEKVGDYLGALREYILASSLDPANPTYRAGFSRLKSQKAKWSGPQSLLSSLLLGISEPTGARGTVSRNGRGDN